MDQFEDKLKERIEAASTPEAKKGILKEAVEKKVEEHREILEKEPEKRAIFVKEVGIEVEKIAGLENTQKIESALKLAEKDLFKAIAVVRQSNDPWLKDTFHDLLERPENYEKLLLSGQLKNL